jgi:hypothetical protein
MSPGHVHHPTASPWKQPSTVLLASLTSVVGLAVIFWLWTVLEAKHRAGLVQWANDTVREHTRAAEQHLANREWDEALSDLEQALATPHTTDLDKAQALWNRARQGRIEALLESALAAIRQQDLDTARPLLQQYLAHPLAAQRQEARLWQEALMQATSDEMAAALLQKLPNETLATFARDGLDAEVSRIRQEPLQPIYRETLKRNLAREQERREIEALEIRARREAEQRAKDEEERRRLEKQFLEEQRAKKERDGRLARIRTTPLYRELTEYLALVRKQHQRFRHATPDDDRRLLTALLTGSGKLKPEERAGVLAELKQQLAAPKSNENFDEWRLGVEEAVSSKRALFKERFHAYPEFADEDRKLFDPLVDRELDQLLVEVRQSVDDDLALGLAALLGKQLNQAAK